MKNIPTLILLILILISCGTDNKPKIVHDNNNTDNNEIKEDSTLIKIADLPVQIDSTNYIIHPIGNFKIEDDRGKLIYKSSSYGSKVFSISNYSSYRISGNLSNVKFQHIDSIELKPLTDKKILIKSLTFLRKIFDNTKDQLLVYEIFDKDTNQDGKINSKDIKSLYISQVNGNDFQKLTSINHELINWKIVESNNSLYFREIEDTNKDGEFDKKDLIHYRFVDLTNDNFKVSSYKPI